MWKKRVYRAVWERVRQFWREERWIRVTDDEENLQWVGLNAPKTFAEHIIMEQTGLSLSAVRKQFENELAQAYQQQPELAQQMIENPVAEIDIDILIEEVPDVVCLKYVPVRMLCA